MLLASITFRQKPIHTIISLQELLERNFILCYSTKLYPSTGELNYKVYYWPNAPQLLSDVYSCQKHP
jgi:hypothetical protein